MFAVQHFVRDAGVTEYIIPNLGTQTGGDFRTGVACAGGGQMRHCGLLIGGCAEIQDVDLVVAGYKDVGRFQIPMGDAAFMRK